MESVLAFLEALHHEHETVTLPYDRALCQQFALLSQDGSNGIAMEYSEVPRVWTVIHPYGTLRLEKEAWNADA